MIFSYNWLQSYFKKKLPKPEKLAEILTMRSFEIEEVKKTGKDWRLDIDILPNRAPDCFSHIGIAREISAITGLNYQDSSLILGENISRPNGKTKDFVSIEIKDKIACSRYTARVITDVKVGESPKYIKERLKVCGLQLINNVVDAANYVMLETGQPMHAFDLDKISGKKIIVRKAKKGEKIITLDNNKYDLAQDILIIADEKSPLAIAGIKGGKNAEIDNKTKTIVLEAANFEAKTIRKARQKLKLQTDASLRFEHCLDINLTEQAINRAACLIQEIAGGKITQGLVDFYVKKVLPKTIKLDVAYVEQLLGVKISKKEVIKILKSLGLNPAKSGIKLKILNIEIPTFRLDLSIQEDLIEEIGRIYGYERIKPVFPLAVLIPPKRNIDCFWQKKVKNILKETGFTEVYNYSFVNEKDISVYQSNKHKTAVIELENPLSAEQRYLRPCLISNLLKNIQKNQKLFNEIKIFELGKVFRSGIKTGVEEKRMLTGILTGDDMFYQTKGIIDSLLNKLGISNVLYNNCKELIHCSQKCAEIKINGKGIGILGEISAEILAQLDIEKKVCVFAIDFEKLQKHCSEEIMYQPISLYPSAVRDLAVLVPREIKVVDVLNKINIAGKKLVRDVALFDIYEGEEIQEGKKNFAFHIIYQAENRTLTSKEIDIIQDKIIKTLEKDPEWEVRK